MLLHTLNIIQNLLIPPFNSLLFNNSFLISLTLQIIYSKRQGWYVQWGSIITNQQPFDRIITESKSVKSFNLLKQLLYGELHTDELKRASYYKYTKPFRMFSFSSMKWEGRCLILHLYRTLMINTLNFIFLLRSYLITLDIKINFNA